VNHTRRIEQSIKDTSRWNTKNGKEGSKKTNPHRSEQGCGEKTSRAYDPLKAHEINSKSLNGQKAGVKRSDSRKGQSGDGQSMIDKEVISAKPNINVIDDISRETSDGKERETMSYSRRWGLKRPRRLKRMEV